MFSAVTLEKSFAQIENYWSPLIIGEMNDQFIKIAKVKGEFVWHNHEHEDEMFYIIKGQFLIEMEDNKVVLNKGDLFVVPKGIQHRPSAEQECWIMLIEPKTTEHTGKTVSAVTKSLDQQRNIQ